MGSDVHLFQVTLFAFKPHKTTLVSYILSYISAKNASKLFTKHDRVSILFSVSIFGMTISH